jgi:hypothetical protein
VFLFASSLTPWLGFVGLVATVVVATQVEDAVVALTVVVVVLTIYLVVTEPKQRFEQRGLFWRYLADAVYEAAPHFVEHCLRFIIAAGRASEWNAGPHVIAVIEHLGCPELTRLALAGDDERFHIRISRECARENLAERKYGLSGTEQAVYWFGDENDPRALLYAFRKLSDPPPRPGFAKSVIQV